MAGVNDEVRYCKYGGFNYLCIKNVPLQSGIMKSKDEFNGERAFVLPPGCVEAMESHPLSALLHLTEIGYYPNAAYHYRSRQEPINQYVMIYCKSGSGWLEFEGYRYEVGSGSYFVLPPGQPHSYGAGGNEPWSIYWLHFKGSAANQYFIPETGPRIMKPALTARSGASIEMLDEIMNILDRGYASDNLLYCCSLLHHFLGALRFLHRPRGDKPTGDTGGDMVNAAISFMKENLDRPLQPVEIADYVGCPQSQFSHCFTQTTGQSPMMYVNQLRINKACWMLDFTDLHINQISCQVGISDPYYFSRLFSRIMGMSPRAYRRVKKG